MNSWWASAAGGAAAMVLAAGGAVEAQAIPESSRVFDEVVLREAGRPVIPFYDGWYQNADGTYSLCFGYYNLNTKEVLDVPLGPDNRLEPAQYQGLQPSHFLPAPDDFFRYWCVFTVQVPEDFGDGEVVWTIRSKDQTLSVPGRLNPAYILEEPASAGRAAVAPALRLEPNGPEVVGRNGVRSGPRQAQVGRPLSLTAWVKHQEPDSWLEWSKHDGPGEVTFSETQVIVPDPDGSSTVTATFSEPGQYRIMIQAMNDPGPRNPWGGFEFLCCWTNGYVTVDVR